MRKWPWICTTADGETVVRDVAIDPARFTATSAVKSTELSAVITLGPDSAEALDVPVGTQIDYGVLASWHRNPLVRFARQLRGQRLPKRDVELARRHQAYALERIKAEAAL